MRFSKLQALGNDFILIDARKLKQDWAKLATSMCNRHFGVGADGLLLLLKSNIAHLGMRIFNPDGSEAEACGNGLSCLARYARDQGLIKTQELTVETVAGVRKARFHKQGIQVTMGRPRFKPEEIPVQIEAKTIPILDYPIIIGERKLELTFISMGNPHAVCFVEEVADFPLFEIGPKVENHPIFPARTNFEIAQVLSRREIKVRVWERGVGETLACGSGACAIAVAARLHGYTNNQVDIILPRGRLSVEWEGKGEVLLSSPAEIVFEGEWKGEI